MNDGQPLNDEPEQNGSPVAESVSDTGSEQPLPTLEKPVAEKKRFDSIDTLRGIAVLGILVINIATFALPMAELFNPDAAGQFSGANKTVWQVGYFVFFQKFMAIFSMLFGAGMILMYHRAKEAGKKFGRVYYRRLLWLLIFGMLHAYFLWFGDILFFYAICGLILYPFRKLRPRNLAILGIIIYLIGIPPQLGVGFMFNYMRGEAQKAEAALEAGEEPAAQEEVMLEAWQNTSKGFNPTPEQIEDEIEIHRGGYWQLFKYRLPRAIQSQFFMLLMFMFWRGSGLMLIGMALMKWGVFTLERSRRFYLITMLICYGVGWPIVGAGIHNLISNNFDVVAKFLADGYFNYIGSIIVGVGHVCFVMLMCKLGLFTWLRERLAAVGRMAFSNYILTTVVMTTIFYGYGFGLFGYFERYELYYFVIGMWIVQLAYSPIWLRYFRFGPLEWLWRTLTYKKKQPFRRKAEVVPEAVT